MHTFVREMEEHLTGSLIPFWERLRDEEYGGYFGYMDYDGKIRKRYEKGCILNSRILWFFSNAYMELKTENLKRDADHAYEFLKRYCVDREYGGVYWSVTYDGKAADDTKHTYNQAFAVYALASYYDAVKNEEALRLAMELFELIEDRCTDELGYLESFNRRFEPEDNEKLSENGVTAEKTMNTLLHVFEAYTELYRVTGDKRAGERLRFMLELFVEKVYNPVLGRQEVFFDREWRPLIDLYSFGHDIETSWLIDRGLAILSDEEYTEKISPITAQLAENIYERAYRDHSVLNEAENGICDRNRIWWVQAEAVVGFLNAYQKNPCAEKYLEAAADVWKYIQTWLIDRREGSEWFWYVDENHVPARKPLVEPWKCPYHNGRMCLEVIRRMRNVT